MKIRTAKLEFYDEKEFVDFAQAYMADWLAALLCGELYRGRRYSELLLDGDEFDVTVLQLRLCQHGDSPQVELILSGRLTIDEAEPTHVCAVRLVLSAGADKGDPRYVASLDQRVLVVPGSEPEALLPHLEALRVAKA